MLDIHDGELVPTLENRRTITRLIREWKADVVLGHRPNDYHPDHRYVGVLVQDAAYMVTVPFFCPDTPPLKRNPVFLYYEDRFQKPNPFSADIVVAIDDVIEKKLAAWRRWSRSSTRAARTAAPQLVPSDEAARPRRKKRSASGSRGASPARRAKFRDKLREWYGAERAKRCKYAEAFEICEYGRRPNAEEIKKLFPFF